LNVSSNEPLLGWDTIRPPKAVGVGDVDSSSDDTNLFIISFSLLLV